MKDIILGMGEVGNALFEHLQDVGVHCIGLDKTNVKGRYNRKANGRTEFLHICIPDSDEIIADIKIIVHDCKPKAVIIHSTIKPKTTYYAQLEMSIPVIYSPIRGRHDELKVSLQSYTKCFACDVELSDELIHQFTIRFPKVKRYQFPITLELAKILCDTTYVGMLIAYRKAIDQIINEYGITTPDTVWEFAEEIHDKRGNRPTMYNNHKKIGGHCIMPNLDLIDSTQFLHIKNFIETYGS